MDVQEIVSTFKMVTLDASIFKAAIEQDTIAGPIVLELLQAIEQGKLSASISALTYSELMGEQKEEDVTKRIQLLLTHFPNLTITPIDVEVANRAADIQQKKKVSLLKALQLASTLQSNSACIIGLNDNQLEISQIS